MSSEIFSSHYATKRKKLLALVNQLRALGAQKELDLPRIVVIGNQSAGKSSVVEAISGINVPRDSGTCTRCPMECRLSSSESPWQCQISIRREYDDKGVKLDDIVEEPFGALITNKEDVELMLRRAQVAVLSLNGSSQEAAGMTLDDLRSISGRKLKKFSRNVICVEISGPELTDLAFIDLPGLIHNADNETVALVEDIVTSYIGGNALILVALPMTDDIENQKALRLAHVHDPQGKRTIGVMTKPDMLNDSSTESSQRWLNVIEGKSNPLLHGYYCTRQPNEAERIRGIPHQEARQAEEHFFRTTSPWSQSIHPNRFGTDNLVATLSRLLLDVIAEVMPDIRKEATERLTECTRQLSMLPKAITENPATFMLNLITDFVQDINFNVRGDVEHSKLLQDNREKYLTFKHAIRRTAPYFVPYTTAPAKPTFTNTLDDDPSKGYKETAEPFTLLDMREHIKRSITRELPNNVPYEAKKALILDFQETWDDLAMQCLDGVMEEFDSLLQDRIKDFFSRFRNLEQRMLTLVKQLIEASYDRCETLINDVLDWDSYPFTQNDHYLNTCTEKWAAKYKEARSASVSSSPQDTATPKEHKAPEATPIAAPKASKPNGSADVKTAFPNFKLPVAIDGGAGSAAQLPRFSFSPPSATPTGPEPGSNATPNPYAPPFNPFATKSSEFGLGRPSGASTPNTDKRMNELLGMLAEFGYTGVTEEDLPKLLPVDEYETELKVMAEVRAYFQVSYKRVIDNIPSAIDSKFLRQSSQALQSFLVSQLRLGTSDSEDICKTLLHEDRDLTARRDELTGREKRLKSVQQELNNFSLYQMDG